MGLGSGIRNPGSEIRDPRSGIRAPGSGKKPIPNPWSGSRCQVAPDPGSGSAKLIKIAPIYKNVFSNHGVFFSITFLQAFDK
jgi:hypothetical protein